MKSNRNHSVLTYITIYLYNIIGRDTSETVHHAKQITKFIQYAELIQESIVIRVPLTHIHTIETHLKTHRLDGSCQNNCTLKIFRVNSYTNHINKPYNWKKETF